MFGQNDNNKFSLKEGRFISHIGQSYRLSTFLSLYENSCNIIYNSLQEKKMEGIDMVSVPLIFLMRHSIEIGLKGQIQNLIKLSECNDSKNSLKFHSLKKLLECFSLHTKKCFKKLSVDDKVKKQFDEKMTFLSEIVNELDLLDEKGTTFRYPKDLNGNKNIESNKKINLLELKNNFDHSMSLLYLTDQVLYDYTDEGLVYDIVDLIEELCKEKKK